MEKYTSTPAGPSSITNSLALSAGDTFPTGDAVREPFPGHSRSVLCAGSAPFIRVSLCSRPARPLADFSDFKKGRDMHMRSNLCGTRFPATMRG